MPQKQTLEKIQKKRGALSKAGEMETRKSSTKRPRAKTKGLKNLERAAASGTILI